MQTFSKQNDKMASETKFCNLSFFLGQAIPDCYTNPFINAAQPSLLANSKKRKRPWSNNTKITLTQNVDQHFHPHFWYQFQKKDNQKIHSWLTDLVELHPIHV